MNRIIGVTELQRKFRSVFEQVASQHIAYVLTRGSRPEAALIPYEDYLRYQAIREAETHARMARLVAKMSELNARFSDEDVERDLAEAERETRDAEIAIVEEGTASTKDTKEHKGARSEP